MCSGPGSRPEILRIAWEQAKERILIYAAWRYRGLERAWHDAGIEPRLGCPRDLIQECWLVIERRLAVFDPDSTSEFNFFRRFIDEVARDERNKAKGLKQKLGKNGLRAVRELQFGSRWVSAIDLAESRETAPDDQILIEQFLACVLKRRPTLHRVAHYLVQGGSSRTSELARNFNRTERWASDRKRHLERALVEFLATGDISTETRSKEVAKHAR